MARNDRNSDAPAAVGSTTGGFGGVNQDLGTGLLYDAEGNAVIPEVRVPDGTTIVQQEQLGAFRRTVFSDGRVETIQTEPAQRNDARTIRTPVPLPGEQQDVAGTGQDAALKPKMAPAAKSGDKK
jgi:hypothetical protein